MPLRKQETELTLKAYLEEYAVDEQRGPLLYQIHLRRYEFALSYAPANGWFLDVGCGEGFGTACLSSKGSSIGLDYHSRVVAHANAKYENARCAFVCGDCLKLPFQDQLFDLVCAFDLIEHLEAPEVFLAEAERVIKPQGALILSTPNKLFHDLLLGRIYEYHVREYYYSDVVRFLLQVLPKANIQIFGQNPYMLNHLREKRGRFGVEGTSILRRMTRRILPVRIRKRLGETLKLVNGLIQRSRWVSQDDLVEALTISREAVDVAQDFIAVVTF